MALKRQRALTFAAGLAARDKARLILVHALLRKVDLDTLLGIAERLEFSREFDEALRRARSASLMAAGTGEFGSTPTAPEEPVEQLGALILEASKTKVAEHDLSVETRLMGTEPVAALLTCARGQNADLLAMGSRGLGPIRGVLLGSVSQRVLQEASCACLIVK